MTLNLAVQEMSKGIWCYPRQNYDIIAVKWESYQFIAWHSDGSKKPFDMNIDHKGCDNWSLTTKTSLQRIISEAKTRKTQTM